MSGGVFLDTIMIPQPFDKDMVKWRKWKDEVTKYFDGDTVGIKLKLAMDNVSSWKASVTSDILGVYSNANPIDGMDCSVLRQWKNLHRALEKLAFGEAATVISTGLQENGFGA